MRMRVDEAWDDDALGRLDNSGVACRDSWLLQEIVSDGRNSALVNENIGAIEVRALRARDDVGVADQNAGARTHTGVWHQVEPIKIATRCSIGRNHVGGRGTGA